MDDAFSIDSMVLIGLLLGYILYRRFVSRRADDQTEAVRGYFESADWHTDRGAQAYSMGDYGEAETLWRHVYNQRRKECQPGEDALVEASDRLSAVLVNLGRADEAKSLSKNSLDELTEVLGASNPKTCQARSLLAYCLDKNGESDAAESLLHDNHTYMIQHFGQESDAAITAAHEHADMLNKHGKQAEAEQLLRALPLADWDSSPLTTKTRSLLASAVSTIANEEADSLYQRAAKDTAGRPGHSVEKTLAVRELSKHLSQSARPDEAMRAARQHVEAVSPDSEWNAWVIAMDTLAATLMEAGKPDEAEEIYRQILDTDSKGKWDPDGRFALDTRTALADSLLHQRRFSEYETLLGKMLPLCRKIHGMHSRQTTELLISMVDCCRLPHQSRTFHHLTHELAEAARCFKETDPALFQRGILSVAISFTDLPAIAEQYYTEADTSYSQHPQANPAFRMDFLIHYGDCLYALGKPEATIGAFRELLTIPEWQGRCTPQTNIAICEVQLGHYEAAEKSYRIAILLCRRENGKNSQLEMNLLYALSHIRMKIAKWGTAAKGFEKVLRWVEARSLDEEVSEEENERLRYLIAACRNREEGIEWPIIQPETQAEPA